MKRINAILTVILTVAMLFTSSCSDKATKDSVNPDYTITPYRFIEFDNEYVFDDLTLKFETIDLYAEEPYISFTAVNNSTKDISFSPSFVIEKETGNSWESCEISHHEFGTKEKGVFAGSSATFNYILGTHFDLSNFGNYRLRVDYYVDALGARDKHEAILNFGISYDAVKVKINSYQFDIESSSINLSWINESDHNIYISDAYSLERFADDTWISCATEETSFHNSIYVIKAQSSVDRSYNFNEKFDVSAPGLHRMTLEYFTASDDTTVSRKIFIEFSITFIPEVFK